MDKERDTPTSKRKSDHLNLILEKDVSGSTTTGLEQIHFLHQALPELDLTEVCVEQVLFGKKLFAPILISPMTGGSKGSTQINLTLARIAQEHGIAMGVGSQRAALEDNTLSESYQVRKIAPGILLFANLGAVQLNQGYGLAECQKAVDMIEADALVLHLNPLQEALQPEGTPLFSGLLRKIAAICAKLPVPVIVKEIGSGISGEVAKKLISAGVSAIDVAGVGGTSWSKVEMYRQDIGVKAAAAANFTNWGIPTAVSIQNIVKNAPEVPIFASGGLVNGIDIAKCLALGAKLGGMATPFLRAAQKGEAQLDSLIQQIILEIQLCLFLTGKKNLAEFDCSILEFNKQ